MLERNRGTWLAAIGAQGLGRDPEIEAIMEQAREHAADRLIEAVQGPPARPPPGAPGAAGRDAGLLGICRGSQRAVARAPAVDARADPPLLVQGFLSIVRDVVPAVRAT